MYLLITFSPVSAGHESAAKRKHMHYWLSARLAAPVSQKPKKSCHHVLNETSVLHGFEINLSFHNRSILVFPEKAYEKTFDCN